MDRCGQLVEYRRCHARRGKSRWKLGVVKVLRQVPDEHVRKDCAKDRGAEGSADRAKERRPGSRHAELGIWHRILRDEHEHLHDASKTHAEHEHVQRRDGRARPDPHSRQQQQADGYERRPGDREEPITARPRDDETGSRREDHHPGEDRQELQTRDRRRFAVNDLEEGRQVRDRTKHREADDKADDARHRKSAYRKQMKRQHGLFAPGAPRSRKPRRRQRRQPRKR